MSHVIFSLHDGERHPLFQPIDKQPKLNYCRMLVKGAQDVGLHFGPHQWCKNQSIIIKSKQKEKKNKLIIISFQFLTRFCYVILFIN